MEEFEALLDIGVPIKDATFSDQELASYWTKADFQSSGGVIPRYMRWEVRSWIANGDLYIEVED